VRKKERMRCFFLGGGGGGDAGVIGVVGGAFDLTWIGVGGARGAAGISGGTIFSVVERRIGG